ncbi:hypothetical protein SXIM_06650 [Streptomyces xiamenensis]|uniref:Uncharacterized protein n=1 Tax=Streptomyces xiamenensis TaxID=408015 RepID=A0A0F7FQ42_9ACTN|nr:hypothetical protein SXIM_06650 [Streptomyces xiamenensis]
MAGARVPRPVRDAGQRQGRDADAAPHLRLAAAMRPDEA